MKYLFATISFVIFLTFLSCKEKKENATVLIQVLNNTQPVSGAVIYAEFGTYEDPKIPFWEYDLSVQCNDVGQAFLENLQPGDYYILATSGTLKGGIGMAVEARKDPNRYEMRISIK